MLPKWKAWAQQAASLPALRNAAYPFPEINPKFLGTVIQKYRLREGQTASAAFQKWIDEIQDGVRDKLIPALRASDMLLPDAVYSLIDLEPGEPILQMSDFNSLIVLSQKHQAPVFCLSEDQLEQTGVVLERTKRSMHQFRDLFFEAADRVVLLTSDASSN